MLVGALLLCLPLHGLSRLMGRRSRWPRRFLGLAARAAGVDTRIAGTPLPRDVLFVANHTSWLDILVLAGASGTRFVSKDDVARWPAIGWLASLNRTIFIARAERGQVRAQADTLASALADGQPVALFPEGTTGDGVALLPFRAALFAAVAPPPAGIRVQPVLIDYGTAAADIAWADPEGAAGNALRLFGRRGRVAATVRFLAPLDPAQLVDRKAIAEASRQAIAHALGEARGHPL